MAETMPSKEKYERMAIARYEALMDFRPWLLWTMARDDLSLREVEAETGVDHTTISRLMRGKRDPMLETALKIVDGLTR